MLYAAKFYWPGVTEDDLRDVCDRAHQQNHIEHSPLFCGLFYLRDSETVLALFEADSPASVKRASGQAGKRASGHAGMPCERVIATVWVAPDRKGGGRCSSD